MLVELIDIAQVQPTYAIAPLLLAGIIGGGTDLLGGVFSFFGNKSSDNAGLKQAQLNYELQLKALEQERKASTERIETLKKVGLAIGVVLIFIIVLFFINKALD